MTFDFEQRLDALRHHLTAADIDLAILNQNADIYYYTGSTHPLYLLVPNDGEPIVLARKALEQIRKEVPHVKLEPFSGGRDLAAVLARHGFTSGRSAGYTLDVTSYAAVTRFQGLIGNPEIKDLSWDIRTLRAVKSELEIALQAKAGEVMAKLPQVVREGFRPGMTELELSVVIESYLRLNGHTGLLRMRREGIELSGLGVCSSGTRMLAGSKFDGICAGTGVSPAGPHGAGYDPIVKGVPIIVDFAFVLEGYHIDQTRMFSWGQPSDRVMAAYQAMVKVEDAIIENLVPGKSWEEVYDLAVNLASELGYGEEFMGLGPEKVRFVGHGVGIELDEPPYLAPKMPNLLEEGMVAAVEPKVALPDIGVIGPEDTFVVRRGSPQRLTTCSREFVVIGAPEVV